MLGLPPPFSQMPGILSFTSSCRIVVSFHHKRNFSQMMRACIGINIGSCWFCSCRTGLTFWGTLLVCAMLCKQEKAVRSPSLVTSTVLALLALFCWFAGLRFLKLPSAPICLPLFSSFFPWLSRTVVMLHWALSFLPFSSPLLFQDFDAARFLTSLVLALLLFRDNDHGNNHGASLSEPISGQ